MVKTPSTLLKAGGKWLKYFSVSACANMLIAHAVSIGSVEVSTTQIPVLKVNLSARAAPQAKPALPERLASPAVVKNVVTEKQPQKKTVAHKPPKPRPRISEEVVFASTAPTLYRPRQKEEPPVAKATVSIPTYDDGQQKSTVVHEANYRRWSPPVYPRRALDLGQEGTVTLHARVAPNGLPKELKVAESSGYRLLDLAALAAVKTWEFEPARADGSTITSWVRVPVRFVIQESKRKTP